MRDLQKDLELCNEFKREIIDNLPKYEVADILKFGRADLINRFHKECREGWPYAIERALKAEAINRELAESLKKAVCELDVAIRFMINLKVVKLKEVEDLLNFIRHTKVRLAELEGVSKDE